MKKKEIVPKGIIARLQALALLALCCFVVQFSSATPAFADAKLFTAMEAGDMAAFRAALDGGANVNERDMRGKMTPEMAWTPLMATCRAGKFDMARELVEHGADINASDGVGSSAFLLAAEHPGSSGFLQYLQDRGANIHGSMDAVGGALELAALQNPDIKVIHTLIGMGLLKDKESGAQSASLVDSCFIAAVRGNPNPEVIKLFVGMGANVQARDLEDNSLAWEGWRIEEKPERLEWLKKNTDLPIPARAAGRQQGYKEVKGNILKEVPYKDSRGSNVVILSRSDRSGDTRSSDLYAYGYANDGASPSLSWKLYDYFHECPVDLSVDFSEQSPIITDLDKNGISEVWLVYYIGCRGDVSPESMKIIMYEGSKKYALRGETMCPTGDGRYMGGKYTAAPAFKDAPPEFRRYADKLWQKNKKRF